MGNYIYGAASCIVSVIIILPRCTLVNISVENMVQVRVSDGVLEGEQVQNEFGGSFYRFRGIPYAQPPLGDLRFKVGLLKHYFL